MSGALGPDDLGWLTLVLSSFKCLNLNSIIPRALGPKVFKLKFNHTWSPRTR